ncbi:MAG: hypothetical protein HC945_03305 [Nitrosarchaeum sp.]|nr:hypothetical protein [Nitrosarchaeum sp.]
MVKGPEYHSSLLNICVPKRPSHSLHHLSKDQNTERFTKKHYLRSHPLDPIRLDDSNKGITPDERNATHSDTGQHKSLNIQAPRERT